MRKIQCRRESKGDVRKKPKRKGGSAETGNLSCENVIVLPKNV